MLKAGNESSDLCSNTLKHNCDIKEKDEKQWKNDNSFSNNSKSTLSLHIRAFENSVEAVAFNGNKKLGNKKQILTASTFVTQNPFEFPRQQNSNGTDPEMSQFSTSQRLFNPNEASNSPPGYNELAKTLKNEIRTRSDITAEIDNLREYKMLADEMINSQKQQIIKLQAELETLNDKMESLRLQQTESQGVLMDEKRRLEVIEESHRGKDIEYLERERRVREMEAEIERKQEEFKKVATEREEELERKRRQLERERQEYEEHQRKQNEELQKRQKQADEDAAYIREKAMIEARKVAEEAERQRQEMAEHERRQHEERVKIEQLKRLAEAQKRREAEEAAAKAAAAAARVAATAQAPSTASNVSSDILQTQKSVLEIQLEEEKALEEKRRKEQELSEIQRKCPKIDPKRVKQANVNNEKIPPTFITNETSDEQDDLSGFEYTGEIGAFCCTERKGYKVFYKGIFYYCTKKLSELFIDQIVRYRCKEKGCEGKIHVQIPDTIGHRLPAPLSSVIPHTHANCLK